MRRRFVDVTILASLVLVCAWAVQAQDKDKEDAANAGPAVNGFSLALSAEKTELEARPVEGRRRPGSKLFSVERTKLILTFTNTSDAPIKLNAYDIPWRHLSAKITGAGVRKDITARNMMWVEPKETDFPTIAPGKSHDLKIAFPGSIGGDGYDLSNTGTCKITIFYRNDDRGNKVSRLAEGCWTGTLKSGTLSIRVVRKR
jgi:hypothetical protein